MIIDDIAAGTAKAAVLERSPLVPILVQEVIIDIATGTAKAAVLEGSMITILVQEVGNEIEQGEPNKRHHKGKHDEEQNKRNQHAREQGEARQPPEKGEGTDPLSRQVVVDVEMAASAAVTSRFPSQLPPAKAQSHFSWKRQTFSSRNGSEKAWLVFSPFAFLACRKAENRTG
jgi:hypothetical protein